MSKLWGLLAAIFLAGFSSGAHAQQNYLIGTWQSSQPLSWFGPANTVTLTFAPNGRYQFQQAFAGRGDGSASGVVTAVGIYRVTGPNQLQWQVQSAQICAAGSFCQPKPDLIGSGVMNYQFEGPSRMYSNGSLFHRVQ